MRNKRVGQTRRPTISRRHFAAASFTALAAPKLALTRGAESDSPTQRCGMGLVIYDYQLRRRWLNSRSSGNDLFEPLTFLKHCRAVGAGGMQARLGKLSAAAIQTLRTYAQQQRLFIEAIVNLPKEDTDVGRFEAEIATARDAGAKAIRTTIIPGRRYERFESLEMFREFERHGARMRRRAVPIVEKHRVRLAVENHKDQRVDERIALLKQIDSPHVGVCLDTGNSLALLDGAYEPIEAMAPYAFTVHLKDQAVREYRDGFLLADVPLGQGSLDLKRIVRTIRHAKPDIGFSLELITRDPLKIPYLTESFWSTLPNVPASDLVRTLRFVREHSADGQQVSGLPLTEQVALEESNVRSSLEFARRELGL